MRPPGVPAANRTHKQSFANAFEQFRSNAVFHYNVNGTVIQRDLRDFLNQHPHHIGISFIGQLGQNEPTMHQLAHDVLNQYFERLFVPLYPGMTPDQYREAISNDVAEVQRTMRTFCHHLITNYEQTLPAFARIPSATPP